MSGGRVLGDHGAADHLPVHGVILDVTIAALGATGEQFGALHLQRRNVPTQVDPGVEQVGGLIERREPCGSGCVGEG